METDLSKPTAASYDALTQALRTSLKQLEEATELLRSNSDVLIAEAEALVAVHHEMQQRAESGQVHLQQSSQIVNEVSRLANRTHILGLNAAIEAARAGEAGEGFRVVAREVQQLAQNSRSLAVEVEEHLKGMGTQMQGVTRLMESIVAQAENHQRAVEGLRKAMEQVNEAMAELRRVRESVGRTWAGNDALS
ncbi:MAG: hypothetical protein IMW91_05210 [Firmicutes bacterium]|nr:hypothetical protein [Bacillota bacterium]